MAPNPLLDLFNSHPVLAGAMIVWSLAWKGVALWKSAERSQKIWFIVMLVVNTLGLLEIIYIFLIARRYKVEVVEK